MLAAGKDGKGKGKELQDLPSQGNKSSSSQQASASLEGHLGGRGRARGVGGGQEEGEDEVAARTGRSPHEMLQVESRRARYLLLAFTHTHSLSPTYSPTHGVAAQGLEHATLKKYRRQFRLDLPLQAQILKSPMYRDLT